MKTAINTNFHQNHELFSPFLLISSMAALKTDPQKIRSLLSLISEFSGNKVETSIVALDIIKSICLRLICVYLVKTVHLSAPTASKLFIYQLYSH